MPTSTPEQTSPTGVPSSPLPPQPSSNRRTGLAAILSRWFSDYGMLLVLLLLCAFYSWLTFGPQFPTGGAAAEQLTRRILKQFGKNARGMILARDTGEDVQFAQWLQERLGKAGVTAVQVVRGQPGDARQALQAAADARTQLQFIACSQAASRWSVLDNLARFQGLAGVPVISPESYRWPTFLKPENLLNIGNQIAVIAIIAVGMTMVIVTGGIDLSVGSLIALSAVVSTWLIQAVAGAENAPGLGLILACLGGIAVCALAGLFSGVMVTAFKIPSFIATLAMMLVASGAAFIVARGQSIYQVPDSFMWLGRGSGLGVPYAVWLMVALYALAHVLMADTVLGRFIYAVGGNPEAARLSGVPVNLVLLFVYTACGALAGLGGIVMASQLKSGSPTYGGMYELYVIAAVVVGGTSLSGGEGKIFGTLIGAFIIAVIQNGMNLTGVESYTQKVVLGLVILAAVLLDRAKKAGWARLTRAQRA